ncbi:LytR C-terminal domain-containing protein [Rhodococcus sp. ARC_M12]|uniref:LytR C-terminal domain-containing protein n=1 Tax=unclassified Rhodococcus (in: high G+C Gram-positive bacteria) TaxID=192944 RepID=UPI001FB2260A|nr:MULTISPECIES: LytR C-terminal domain-containing protein [unclassified Rhodococcus (in: high G+C Gram-positive bacteria)]MCJ0891319.1 LytR C-terminal domain-containing protein [Rhodococcus sp. ARC_M5]MCJ0977682.1 LytR C-terminal domain-containing protein [Rhodococcus sp. ARC_M12]
MSSPNPEQTGPPLRALAMVLISLAILFAAIGALSLTGSDSDDAAAEPTAETTSAPASVAPTAQAPAAQVPAADASTGAAAPTTTSGAPADVEVRVLNNSNVSGLAAGTADTLTAEGWNVAETGNFSADQFAQTAVYYGTSTGEEQAAQTIATQLGVPAEPKPTSLESTAGVVVIVTQ